MQTYIRDRMCAAGSASQAGIPSAEGFLHFSHAHSREAEWVLVEPDMRDSVRYRGTISTGGRVNGVITVMAPTRSGLGQTNMCTTPHPTPEPETSYCANIPHWQTLSRENAQMKTSEHGENYPPVSTA